MNKPDPRPVNYSRTMMTELVMPNDTNPLGHLMGGNLMRWMDIAGGICAARHCGAHAVTASVDNVSFAKPIHLGDVITIKASVTRAFNTSVEIYLEVFTTSSFGADLEKSNHAYMTFVGFQDLKAKGSAAGNSRVRRRAHTLQRSGTSQGSKTGVSRTSQAGRCAWS